jgi:hypothetical protein
MTNGDRDDGFTVTPWIDRLGGHMERHRSLWIWLGNIETRLVGSLIAGVVIERPIYIAGLARSGTTILLEVLAQHPAVATHRYRDFPPLFTPYLWNRWLDFMPRRAETPHERTHADGIAVTAESPEAFEEVLWAAFLPHLHDPAAGVVLDRNAHHPGFEAFYRAHIRKLLAVRNRPRYTAKGNYNVTRLGYLHRLFPDARFLIPVRDPVWHIASLMKQQTLFTRGQGRRPEAVRHLRRVGHFEFGLDRRPINTSNTEAVREIMRLWGAGDEVAGWARYWALVHDHIADRLRDDPLLREASLVVHYENLCREPRRVLSDVLAHAGLDAPSGFLDAEAQRIHAPGYYRPQFTPQELAIIRRETAATAARLGYEGARSAAGAAGATV